MDAIDRTLERVVDEVHAMHVEARSGFEAIKAHSHSVDTQLATIGRRFNAVDGRFNGMDLRFNAVEASIVAVDDRLSAVQDRLGQIGWGLATAVFVALLALLTGLVISGG